MSRLSPYAFDDLVRSALTSRAQSIVINPAPTPTPTSRGHDASTDAPPRERRPRGGALVAVAATVLVAVVALGAIALTRGEDTPPRVVTPQTAKDPDAEPQLDFVVREPTQAPTGWVRTQASVGYAEGLPGLPGRLPTGVGAVPVSIQEWAPPGIDVEAAAASGACPPFLHIIQRKADQEEIAQTGPDGEWPGNIDLGNGEIIGGGWETVSCGGPDGEQFEKTMLSWVDGDVYIIVHAVGVDHETVLAIVRSLSP